MKIASDYKIAILGCGWLGLPLALDFVNSGFSVNGSTTKTQKLANIASLNIVPFLVQLDNEIIGDHIQQFLDADLLIINIPPGRHQGTENNYLSKMNKLAVEVVKSPIAKIIFISSTSVYPEINNLVTENSTLDLNNESAKILVSAEEVFKNIPQIKTTIIRFSGLIGSERHPGRFFGGKENIPNGLAPINLIHLDDCIGIINWVIEKEIWGEIINGVAPDHPQKMDFYSIASEKYNQSSARFIAERKAFKIVSSAKIIEEYGYLFKVPRLMDWLLQTPRN
jgi:nucleoside-diphosphate-sugar epimerase